MNTTKDFEGVYSLGKNGIAYIKNKETGDVIEVPSHLHKSADQAFLHLWYRPNHSK